ncbi:heparan-alpha-glucosaminide N-acetyltransferase domain-containing protein [Tomitella gaofuii]|uniref:heparan-alpha-glucosaminide N-acetyltransferase domain-containing protein n=1 Tax=Tomitella gaofuii TaxID=2760083 RepID=UPI0015FDB6EE|nr:heparan-alpha-glucosaminide N-acetyltransferase domain-containing protein [Tomitella gaofuii]
MTTTIPDTGYTPAVPAPDTAARTPRIIALDVTRALAIVGMIAVHSLYIVADDGGPTVMYRISAGHASAAFAVLAGVSISLIAGRRRLTPSPEAAGKAASLATRAVIIGIIGLLLGYTLPGLGVVILPYYALMFLLAVPLAFLGTWSLVGLTVILLVGAPALSQAVRPHIVDTLGEQLSFGYLFGHPAEFLSSIAFTGEFPAIVWMTYVCAGMVIGRITLRSARTGGALLAAGLALMFTSAGVSWALWDLAGGRTAATAGIPSDYASEVLLFGADGVVPTNSWWWLAFDGPHTGTPLDLMATLGSTLAVLGAIILAEQGLKGRAHTVMRWVLAPLAAVGTMSLTVYVGHIMFINSDFDVYGPTSGFVRQLVVIALFALAWHATAGRGPLEGLVAACTRRADARARARGEHRTN